MKKHNIIQEKSFDFAIKTINLYKYLAEVKHEYILSKQLLKCGTSVGANIEEALGSQSRKGFTAKMFISYREARKVRYWIKLLTKTGYVEKKSFKILLENIEEICKILGKILKTSRYK